jgi:penicillin-binding protein 1A
VPYHLARIAKLGRAKIVETARKMGVVNTPLADTVSLPLGADEVKMMDMVSANATFANGGKRAVPYASVEVRNSRGDLLYRRDRDGPPMTQVIPADKIAEMNNLLKEVVIAGTGRAARLDGVVVAGKTGTTNAYRDAWFNGFTGNFVGSVWFGNDDDSSMNNMTGGTLPARTWHEIMAYAHQGIELKNPYGITDTPPPVVVSAASSGKGGGDLGQPSRPVTLSRRSAETLVGIEEAMHAAERKRQSYLGSPNSSVRMVSGEDARDVVRAVGGRIDVR